MFEGETQISVDGYATDLFTARAIDFIERKQAGAVLPQPALQCAALALAGDAEPKPVGRGRPGFKNYEGGRGVGDFRARWSPRLDEGVGRVLDRLDALDLAGNTIVVLTSDNGGERFSYHWPLRGAKNTLFEGGVRVPTLVRWPGRIHAGLPMETDQVTMSMDWLPTLAAAAGAGPLTRAFRPTASI